MTIAPMDGFDSKKKWPEGAIEDWQYGASYGWLESKYGRAYSTVAKLIRAQKDLGVDRVVDVRRRKRNGGRRGLYDRKPLSARHIRIGLQISRFRDIDNELNCEEFAEMIGTNRLTARMMELGLYDFRLTDLEKLSETIGVPLQQLLPPDGEPTDA